MKARDVMTPDPVTVSPLHSVRHAAQIMLERHVSGLPVLDDEGRLVGLVTEGDLLRRAELGVESLVTASNSAERTRSYVRSHSWKVADVMACDLITVDEETSLGRVAVLMAEHRVKRVPVMRDGRLVGIVSRADLLHGIATARLDDTAPGDDAIRRSILTRLRDDAGVAVANLSVTVKDGIVHFWGSVASEGDRNAARVVAEGVRGVEGIFEHFSEPADHESRRERMSTKGEEHR